jgi:hypothetical protein
VFDDRKYRNYKKYDGLGTLSGYVELYSNIFTDLGLRI